MEEKIGEEDRQVENTRQGRDIGIRSKYYRKHVEARLAEDFPKEERGNEGDIAKKLRVRRLSVIKPVIIKVSKEISLVKTHEIAFLTATNVGREMNLYDMQTSTKKDDGSIEVSHKRVYGNVPVIKLDDEEFRRAYLQFILNKMRLDEYSGYLGELERIAKKSDTGDISLKDKFAINIDDAELNATKQIETRMREQERRMKEISKKGQTREEANQEIEK